MCTSVMSGTFSVSSVHASARRADLDDFRFGKLDVEPSDMTLRLSLDRQRLGLL